MSFFFGFARESVASFSLLQVEDFIVGTSCPYELILKVELVLGLCHQRRLSIFNTLSSSRVSILVAVPTFRCFLGVVWRGLVVAGHGRIIIGVILAHIEIERRHRYHLIERRFETLKILRSIPTNGLAVHLPLRLQ